LDSSPQPSSFFAYRPAQHRFAVVIAGVTLVLIVAGALVTSNDAGLSVPDWPTSYGSFYKLPPWTGGIVYEHSHRMIAEFVGFLTVLFAIFTWKSDRRRWIKGLKLGAVATVVAQGVLGGLTVIFFLPAIISSAHALVAQTFFCLMCSIALFTSRGWLEDPPQLPADSRQPSLLTLALLSVLVLYVQLFFGAMFRHHGMNWLPHVLNAPIVALILTWTAVTALVRYPKVAALRVPAIAILGLLIVQLGLGFLAFLTRVEWGKDAAQPELPMIVSTVAHVATGACLLATTVIFAIQVWRFVPVSVRQPVHATNKPVTAT
jgi:cytochrome c oxidase assembly protein subunit 15